MSFRIVDGGWSMPDSVYLPVIHAQYRHIPVHLLVGHFSIALRGADIPVPHSFADSLDGYAL